MEKFFKNQENVLLVHSDDASESEITTNKSTLESIGVQVKSVSLSAVISGKRKSADLK